MGKGIKMNTEQFVKEAKLIHGDKYDYSETVYTGANKKVKIICPDHGLFEQRASSHLEGYGCKLCSRENREKGMTTEEYIARAKEVHGDKYDYSKTVYKGSLEDVCVTCYKHGDFYVNASNHINKGAGCKECFYESRRIKAEEFFKRAKEKHNNKYDYSKSEFIDMNTPICIICPEHDEFWQKPKDHLNGGCIKCGGKFHKTQEEFIADAIRVHGDKYTYDKVVYVNSETKVIVTCKRHGDFEITPRSFLQGQGCLKCYRDRQKENLVCGIGVNDYYDNVKEGGENKAFYEMWRDMLKRCYVNCYIEGSIKDRSYKDCIVCDEWIYLSNFAKFFLDPQNGYREGYSIDKDLLAKDGKKIYSPETCCFVPPLINSLITKQKQNRGEYPIGVTKRDNDKFYANVSNPFTRKLEFLGVYENKENAFMAYKNRKMGIVKEVADMYYSKGEITDKVYNALLNFKIDIND